MLNRALLAVFVGVLGIAPTTARADDSGQVFVILNRTKADLLELYTSPAEAPGWGADQLGNMRIGAGGKVTLKLGNPAGACLYDLMMVFADGEKVVRRADVCVEKTLIVTEHQEPGLPAA